MKNYILHKIGSIISRLKLYKLINTNSNKETAEFTLMFFTGYAGLDMLNASLISVLKNWEKLPNVLIVSDGADVEKIKSILIKWPKKINVDYWHNVIDIIGDDNLKQYAKSDVWGKKFVSILAAGMSKQILYTDTDVLWFSDPGHIISEREDKNCTIKIKMCSDNIFAYSNEMIRFFNWDNLMENKACNAGLIYLSGNLLSLNESKMIFDYLSKKYDNRSEQTAFAYYTINYGTLFNIEDVILNTTDIINIFPNFKEMKNATARHYVTTKGWLFWRDYIFFIHFK